jgi:hypothetical protein
LPLRCLRPDSASQGCAAPARDCHAPPRRMPLGRLAGAGRHLPDPHLLVSAYITREAVASSRIEGTQASVTEIFDAVVSGRSTRSDIREARNYIVALRHGVQRLVEFPLSLWLMREMHGYLMADVRGHDKTPGEFRLTQNWISSPANQPATARFVPPTVADMHASLRDWESYTTKAPGFPFLCASPSALSVRDHPPLPGRERAARHHSLSYASESVARPPFLSFWLFRAAQGGMLRALCNMFVNAVR